MADALTFADGVLGGHDSVKGFKVVATDGAAGKVSWASYAPEESYLVVTVGRLARKHHVVPAGAVTGAGDGEVSVAYLVVTVGRLARKHHVVPAGAVTGAGDGEVSVALTRAEIQQLPDVPQPDVPIGTVDTDQLQAVVDAAIARSAPLF